jgi:hypothetical protein
VNLDEYASRVREIEQKIQRAERARGSLDELLKQVKKLFLTGDLDKAERELTRMEKEFARQEKVFVRAKHEWGDSFDRKLAEFS